MIPVMLRKTLLPALLLIPCLATQAQTPQQAANQYAFARLYGYVRYFHPADAVVVTDWDALAIYGAKTVDGAKNTEELKASLEAIFHPIAPTLRIYETGKPPKEALPPPADAGRLKVVTWQHNGYGAAGNIYKSIRTNSYTFPPKSAGQPGPGFSNLFTTIGGKPYRGLPFRFTTASLATNLRDALGQYWVRVDRESGTSGFFNNMSDRPVTGTSAQWRRDTIAGTIDADAKSIVFGIMVLRNGSFLADDLRFEVQTPDGWKALPLNGGFEQDGSGKDPSGWQYNKNDRSMTVSVVKGQAAEGASAVEVGRSTQTENAIFSKELFPNALAAGTLLRKDIGNGLSIEMPLALWGDGKTAFPLTDTAEARALSRRRSAELPARLTAENLYVRLADVIITWNIYQHFHPYFQEWTTDWDQDLRTAIAASYRDTSVTGFEQTLARLNARIRDGHTFVSGPQTYVNRRFLPLRLTWADNSLVVTDTLAGATKATRGTVVTAINGLPARQYLQQRSELVCAGSANAMMRQTIGAIIHSRADSSLQLTFRDPAGQTWQETVAYSIAPETYYGKQRNTRPPAYQVREDGIVYVDITRCTWAEMKDKMKEIAGAKGLIVDLRGYPKDNNGMYLINHLIEKKDKDRWMHSMRLTHPDHENISWDSFGWDLSPLKPRIEGKTVFLTDGSAISYSESVMGYIKDQRLATIIGEPTAGANGNVAAVALPGGFAFRFTGLKVTHHDGSQHYTKGIGPDILMAPSIQGIIDQRDELLEKAVEVINASGHTVKPVRGAG